MSNPYVGIQHTVFKHGWRRALKEMEDRVREQQKDEDKVPAAALGQVLANIEEIAGDAD